MIGPHSVTGGCGGDFLPHNIRQGVQGGVVRIFVAAPDKNFCIPLGEGLGAAPLNINFGKKSLVKYCNLVVNLDYSLYGHRYDGRSYFMVFLPRRKPSLMREFYCGFHYFE
jgi:hypothetical protein